MSDATSDCGRRGVTWSILLGIALGGAVGAPRYGIFSVGDVAMIGLGVIVCCGVYALIVAFGPARSEADEPS